jgi:type II secretory pathway pseudopilin PulG
MLLVSLFRKHPVAHLRPKQIRAFTLVEVVLSLGIFIFAAFGLIGLLAVGLQTNQDSKQQLQAATIAEALCSTRRAAPTNDFTTSTVQPNFPLPPFNVAANNFSSPTYLTWDGLTTNAASARFALLYKITPTFYSVPTGNATTGVSTVYLCFYWPAQAASTNTTVGHFEVTSNFPLQ